MKSGLTKLLKALPTPRRRVRVALAVADVTQIQMAVALGMDHTHLSNALNGHRSLTSSQEQQVADYLGVPRAVLFKAAA
jgi:transcriptional regulator with XRE-family HTH domain